MKTIAILSTLLAAGFVLQSCDSDIVIPALPEPEQATIEQGVTLSADKLFGIWEGSTEVGTDNTDHFEQNYRVEFQSVDDAEAIFSHWYTDASSVVRDSVCGLEYSYTFDGSTIEMIPSTTALAKGATRIKAVHTGDNRMNLYSIRDQATTTLCQLVRTSDPEPSVTGVDRTLPQPGETVTLRGRNLQFVDHLYLPTASGELEVTDFSASSRQIQFTLPQADLAPGHIRMAATGAHVNIYSPVMFCHNCVFFHNFSTQGTSAPYTGTEFENTINITQSLFDKVTTVASANLPEGHALTLASKTIVSPDTMLCYFAGAPVAWPVDGGLDPSTGMLRFSFGDRMQYVVDHSDGLVTAESKCKELAIEMDIYVYSDGEPVWNTGFISFRLDKDQGKSLTQSWFAQTAMWDIDHPISFADGWLTFTIPMSAFKVTESETYATLGSLMNYLKKNRKQAIVKMLNYQLDAQHPAQALDSFQFCIANMRLVPYGIPASEKIF